MGVDYTESMLWCAERQLFICCFGWYCAKRWFYMKEFISFKNQRDVRSLSFAGCDGAFCSIGCARGLHGLCKSRDYIYETKLARLRVKIIKREHTTRPTRLIYYSLKFLRPNFATIKAIIQTKEKTITRKGRCKTKKLFSTD